MARLRLDYARCVLSTNRQAACRACVDICPSGALRAEERGIAYAPGLCTACGGCLGACPTEAFSLGEFSLQAFIPVQVAEKTEVIGCREMEVCLGALAPEYLIGLALELGHDLALDLFPCAACEIAEKLLPQIEGFMATANRFLEQSGVGQRIVALEMERQEQESTKRLSRRELFSKVNVKDALRAKQAFDAKVAEGDETFTTPEDAGLRGEQLREKHLPFRRRFFINALANIPAEGKDFAAATIPFITAKRIDKAACTNCARCYQVCPTGALHGERLKGSIFFDFLHCVGCGSCHTVCEPACLHQESILARSRFIQPERERLASFFMRQCGDCGMPYINDGEPFCPRCREMDAEARELVGF